MEADLYGETFWGKMHIRLLWVHPDRRHRGEGNASRHYFDKDLLDKDLADE